MTQDSPARHPNLFYEDDQETDDIPALTPYHSTLDGRQGIVTLPQAVTPTVRHNTPTAYPAAVPRTMRDAA